MNLTQSRNTVLQAHDAGIFGAEVKQAIRFLHELGTVQHFDNEFLKDKVVINPQWIVDVMACVVSVHNTVSESCLLCVICMLLSRRI